MKVAPELPFSHRLDSIHRLCEKDSFLDVRREQGHVHQLCNYGTREPKPSRDLRTISDNTVVDGLLDLVGGTWPDSAAIRVPALGQGSELAPRGAREAIGDEISPSGRLLPDEHQTNFGGPSHQGHLFLTCWIFRRSRFVGGRGCRRSGWTRSSVGMLTISPKRGETIAVAATAVLDIGLEIRAIHLPAARPVGSRHETRGGALQVRHPGRRQLGRIPPARHAGSDQRGQATEAGSRLPANRGFVDCDRLIRPCGQVAPGLARARA